MTQLQRGLPRSFLMGLWGFGKVIEIMRAVVRVKAILERSIAAVRDWEERRVNSIDVL